MTLTEHLNRLGICWANSTPALKQLTSVTKKNFFIIVKFMCDIKKIMQCIELFCQYLYPPSGIFKIPGK
jgi:hypothetical protein